VSDALRAAEAEPLLAPVDWKEVAGLLADELERWGWGDFHYAVGTKQDVRVRAILAFYRDAQGRHYRQQHQAQASGITQATNEAVQQPHRVS